MKTIKCVKEMCQLSKALKLEGKMISFIPTMGYLHEGHLSLIREGRMLADAVVVSIFVNPSQFNENADFEAYPSDTERDKRLLLGEGVDVLFMPDSDSIYPEVFETSITLSEVSKGLCGDSRPGHFEGVATVVAKLFNIVMPDLAFFGEKDYQQLVLIRRMVRDLNFNVEIIGMPIVREGDGLAMSSRNARLSADERELARSLNHALARGKKVFLDETQEAGVIIEEALKEIEPGVDVEYLEVRDTETLKSVNEIEDEALLAIAARVGNIRLIDNTIMKEGK